MTSLLCVGCVVLCYLTFAVNDVRSVNWNIADSDAVTQVRKSSTVPAETWRKEKIEPHLRKAVRQSLHVARKRVGMKMNDVAEDDCRDNKNYTAWCSAYRENDFCNLYPYGMQKFCPLTCGFCKCKAKIDIAFLVDSSTSIEKAGKGNYQKCLDFIKNAVNGSYVSEEYTHIGLVLFSSKLKIVFDLKKYYDTENMTKAIDDAPYLKGGTLTGKALKYVKTELFNKTGRAGVPRVLIVMTDGRSTDDVVAPAQALHAMGITTFAIGIGRAYDIMQLIEIASKPDVKYALTSDFNRLNDLYTNIRDDACKLNSTLVDEATEASAGDHDNPSAYQPHSPHTMLSPAIAVLKSKSRIETSYPTHLHRHVKHG